MHRSSFLFMAGAAIFFVGTFSQICEAEKFCKNRDTAVVTVRKKCKKQEKALNLAQLGLVGPQGATGLTGATGPQGDTGPAGATGTAGQDGTLRVYGDGSAGPLVVSSDTDWATSPPEGNVLYFTDCTINEGVTLTVPSGTVIRCAGAFTNNGTITVSAYAFGGGMTAFGNTYTSGVPGIYQASEGMAPRAPGIGEIGDTTINRGGGQLGIGVQSAFVAASILRPGPLGGGGGMGSVRENGAMGGGTFTVIAQGALNNSTTGTIRALGNFGGMGCGGGGGGIIILASGTSIGNDGAILARGGGGGISAAINGIGYGGGGGGGGGIVHLIAPSITLRVAPNVAGGSGGAATLVSAAIHQGGGGGGACGGDGGSGGSVPIGNLNAAAGAGQNGSSGFVIQTVADPAPML